MSLTSTEKANHEKTTNCHICGGASTDSNDKVRDHCHRTGCYRGAAHSACDLNYVFKRYLPTAFHHLQGYDSRSVIKQAFEIEKDEKIDVIPSSGEKFMTLSIGNLTFIDSYQISL
jgi:hypothetical protein